MNDTMKKSIIKGLKYLLYIGLPVTIDIIIRGDYPWLGMTVGSLLKMFRDYAKHKPE